MNVKELRIRLVPMRVARTLIERHHYSHRWPSSNILNYGVYHNKRLLGICTFGTGASNNLYRLVNNTERGEYLELTRLWLHDKLPKNSESRVISICLRDITKRFPQYKWVVSYADTEQEHQGTIYQATNWIYTGTGGDSIKTVHKKTGKEIHTRTLSSNKLIDKESLEQLGIITTKAKPKHRYIYPLQKGIKKEIAKEIKPYPNT